MKAELYTDGSCRGNPGIGGWGVLVKYEESQHELFGYERDTTNNRMELLAAIRGIQTVEKACEQITVYTDSQYLCKGVTEWLKRWKQNGWKTASGKAVKNDDLWKALDNLTSQRIIEWCWVRGHSGNQGNERADALANLAIDRFLNTAKTKNSNR